MGRVNVFSTIPQPVIRLSLVGTGIDALPYPQHTT
jgi:hypothetical protein